MKNKPLVSAKKKQELLKLLDQSIFIKPAAKAKIRAQIDQLYPEQVEAFLVLLRDAEFNQKYALAQVCKHDPKFMKELETHTAKQIKRASKENESKTRASEVVALSNLDLELEKL